MSERTATTVYGSLGEASCAVLRRRRGSSSRSSRINLLWPCWKWQGEKGPFGNVKRTPLSGGRRDVAGRSGATGGDVATGAHQRVFFCRAWAVWFRWAALRR